MANVTIEGTEFRDVSRKISKRRPTIDSSLLPITKGFKAEIDHTASQLVLLTEGGVVLVQDTGTLSYPWDTIQGWDGEVLIANDRRTPIAFDFQGSADRFGHLLRRKLEADVPITHTEADPDDAPQSRALPLDRITTLQELPGHVTVHGLGLVGSLQAASGFTAGSKGRSAMDSVLRDLASQAYAIGANAVTGLNSNAFGAGGGITGVLGGDAVGVLLIGTAVRVVPIETASDEQDEQ